MHGDPDHGISVHILVECQSKNINPIIIPFNVQHYLNNKTPETYQLKKIIKLRRKKCTSIFYNQLGTIPRVIGKNLKNFYYLIIFNSKFGYLCHFYFFCKYLPTLKIHKTKKQNYFGAYLKHFYQLYLIYLKFGYFRQFSSVMTCGLQATRAFQKHSGGNYH